MARLEVAPGERVAVVAANVDQARHEIREVGLTEHSAQIVTLLDHARGEIFVGVLWADGWTANPDAERIATAVRLACLRPRRAA